MKRRVFLKTGAVAASLVSSLKAFPLFTTSGESMPKPYEVPNLISGQSGATQEEIRSAGYLRRVRADKYLPLPPVFAESKLTPDIKVTPMALEERLRRKIRTAARLL